MVIDLLNHVGNLSSTVKIIYISHLGNQGLNASISKDINDNEIVNYKKASDKPATESRSLKEIRKDNRLKRLAVISHRIHEQI